MSGAPESTAFESAVKPFVARTCVPCHNSRTKTAGLDLSRFRTGADVAADLETWEKVLDKLRTGQMPPPGMAKDPAQTTAAVQWIGGQIALAERNAKPDPGRVTARRLNRSEYNNTIRDLLGVAIQPADDFPLDDAGYGFDNIGDVLSISPVLMEKYLTAAETVAKTAIAIDPLPKPALHRFQRPALVEIREPDLMETYTAVLEGDYTFEVKVGGLLDPMMLVFAIDGATLAEIPLSVVAAIPRIHTFTARLTRGTHVLIARLVDTFPPKQGERTMVLGNKLVNVKNIGGQMQRFVDSIDVRGPANPVAPPEPESHRKVFVCGHPVGKHQAACARTNLASLARRAYRRPVADDEIARLERLAEVGARRGGTFEHGIRLALQGILMSPHFLFRIERDPAVSSAGPVRLNDFELASRLSYFLWSSMPDETLFRLAEEGTLRQPAVLEAQVRRMLADPKSQGLVESFAGQWLQTRNLDVMKPDPAVFPVFDESLRAAMKKETQTFFTSLLQEDRSILDLLDSRDAFVNGALARLYGIPGVDGKEFQRVRLPPRSVRGGVLTQASVLLVSSYPSRTSPVLRGKWVLENLLNAPPPPPPPNVPNLSEEGIGTSVSVRQQLEKHRENPACASCHARMDPLGFALENFDAIGRWRTHDGKVPIDPAGALPDGRAIRGPVDLKRVLLEHKDDFTRGFTEALLTFALGRGVERYDRPALTAIGLRARNANYRFSSVVLGIVNSMPFQMKRPAAPHQVASQSKEFRNVHHR